MDVTEWLSSLGLARYASAFRDNDIDREILHRLTEEDLRELGVASIGHRRRILDAIAALRDGQSEAERTPTSGQTPRIIAEVERRHLTVMISDIVDSTALSTALDPEDLQKVISAYNHCVSQTVARFDGYIARYIGDSALVFFGYPKAHEDDAERAVRTGLALIDAISRVSAANGIQLRVGIATGIVVVGDIIDDGDTRLRDVVGETPYVAARLQSIAEPSSVVIADSTRGQVGTIFDLSDLGLLRLKGFTRPQRAWRVLGESGVPSRFEALRSEATPLVGRDEELNLLMRRWQQTKADGGRVVLLSGEAGIGKSRLAATLSHAIEIEPHLRLRYSCSPYNQDSVLHPIIVQLENAAGFTRHDSDKEKLSKLTALLAPGAHDTLEITLLAELLSLPNSATDLNLAPQRKRERLFEVLFHQIQTMAQSRPVLIIFEDAHWIDPTSHELLDLLVDRASQIPVLLIVTSRFEFQHAWSGQPHVTVLVLNRLDGREGVALVERIAGNVSLPSRIVDEIVQRADGVPLFVEELTKGVLEADVDNSPAMAPSQPRLSLVPSIPATLHASLIARFDRVGSKAKEIAQIGAVLGREFGYDLIELTAQQPIAELRSGLDRLVAAGLFYCRGVAPQSSYVFKHSLVQDAAYSTMLRIRRQELHARVAAVLERDFSDLIERQPEMLAHHLTASGENERAVDLWLKAGYHAAARSAHLEAIRHFDRGLAILPESPDGSTRDGRELELQLARGPSLFAARGFASAEAAKAYTRASELAERLGDARQLFAAVNGLWQSANGAGRMIDCRRLSNRLQELTASTSDDALRLQAHHSAWATSLFTGDPEAARDHCAAGNRIYDPERHGLQHQLYGGHDPGSCALYLGAQAHWLLGFPEKGLTLCNEGLAMAERRGHPFSLACALQYYSMLHLERGEFQLALSRLEEAEALVADQRLGFVLEPQLLRGAALTAQGAFEEAESCVREGLGGRNGATRLRCYGLVRLADALSHQGKHDEALAAARDGLKTSDMTEHRQWQAELHRLEGTALFGLGQLQEGQAALEQAMRVAHRQKAKAYELRAAVSLAQLWSEQRRRVAAHELLASVYGCFGEGFGTADLKNAKALLDQLA
jgi:class 3 adenylate cyclase/tetratricopeptide (TPR) repeat protein